MGVEKLMLGGLWFMDFLVSRNFSNYASADSYVWNWNVTYI